MFKNDLLLINWICRNCKILGGVFGFGAFEGFIIYIGIMIATILNVINNKESRKNVR